jgi:VCBS repeat-containing protein
VGDIATGATAYSLTGTDAGLFTINSSTGAVTLTANPNFEAKSSYSFNVVATDTAGNFSTKAVTLGINNLDEVAPTITSSATATAIDENSGAAQVVYTATSTDVGDIATGATAYSLSGTDAGLFSINSSTGAVSLTTNPNFETKASYSFNVIATDTVGNFSTKAVTLAINDLNEAPSVTSGGTLSVAENSTGTVYTATGTDPDPAQTLSWSISGTDAALFSINSTSGALTFNTVPNFEIPADNGADNVYDLTVIATDNGTGNLTASKAVVITVTNVNEAPTTSAPASISVVEDVASALTGISFADVDAGSSSVTATLAVNSGTLIATSGSGVTVTGSGTASMSLAGTLANINAFIASSAVSFTTALNSIGNVTLSSSLNDNGNSGSGGALSSAVSATILNVTGIADTPSVASLTINEDIDSGAITITRNAADSVEVTHYKITSITGGTLYSDAGFTTAISAGSFIASSGATTNVYFRPIANANTAGSFTVQASTSNADAGLGGTTATSTINITPIADTASVTSSTTTPSTQTTSGLVISRNAVDGVEVTNFKITNIINGTLYQNDGTTQITAGSFITFAQANAGLKFTPSGVSNGSFDVQASTSNVDAGLGGAVSTATISLGISIANANTNEDTGTGAIAITGNTGFYKITGLTGGTLYSDAGFTTPIANDGFITTSGATTNVYFRPAADFNGTAGFTIQGSSSNSDAGLGGNTATSTITVNPVNDAPTGSGNLTLSAVDEDTVSPAGAAINTLAGLNFTDVDAGASLSGVAVIANTANVNTQGVWQYSTNGTNWYNIGTVTGNSAVALSATSLVRFVPALNFNGTPPSLTVRALDNTYAEGFTNGAVLVKTNANINGGSSGISANTNTIDTRIAAVNDAPVWSGLANTVNFTEDSAAVALGSAITLSDVDLNALSYADATLTLVRNGSANTDDVFANTGTLGALTQGGNLTVNGVVIGTVTTNSAGLLTLTFNNNATKALVSSALQQITYSNASNTPPASVQIMWLFNDNNTGAQGKGAALSALRSTTVAITPTNDAPVAVNDSATVVNGGMLSGISLLANDSDPENDTLTVNTTPIINVAHGTLTLYANGSYLYQNDGSAAKTDSFVYEIIDGHGGKAQATITMTINGSPLVNQPTGNVVFLNNLSVFFDNFLTSGSLMLLSNRDNYIESHSRYVFEDKKHLLDHDYHGDYALPSVHLSL